VPVDGTIATTFVPVTVQAPRKVSPAPSVQLFVERISTA
jgi:hypothetical protein